MAAKQAEYHLHAAPPLALCKTQSQVFPALSLVGRRQRHVLYTSSLPLWS